MLKEWFISINGVQKGPYTPLELRHHIDVTPDTLVWREGFSSWVPIRDVAELRHIFKDDPESTPVEDLIKPAKKISSELKPDHDTLAMQHDPIQFFLWLIIVLLCILYVLIQLNRDV